MRLLVLGASGFVGRHFARAGLAHLGAGIELRQTARNAEPGFDALDISDRAAVRHAIVEWQPTHVLNLAGIAETHSAAQDPDLAWRIHLDGVRVLGAAILDTAPETVLVNAGTGLVYGRSFIGGEPLDENAVLQPRDVYAASKGAGDLALMALAAEGLRCVLMRPFNHVGPGQVEAFVVPAFAAQIARIEAGLAPPVLHVGNLAAERDFLDVEDVVRAYALALVHGDALEPGLVLNVASGTPWRIEDVLAVLLELSPTRIAVEVDPTRMRPSDIPRALGDAGRAHRTLGWAPEISFETTLRATLEHWRARIAAR